MASKVDVWKYILSRISCDDSCKYSSFCPSMVDGVQCDDCIIRRDYKKMFDSFYNLYFGEFDGLKSEMMNVAYRLKEQASTPEEALTYFNSLVKIMNNCYSPEKIGKEDMITEVMVNINNMKKV